MGSTLNRDFVLTACAFCGEPEPLRESHIIPRFVYDWLKRTSATGHIRMSGNPNLRVQDGYKPKLLCGSCEQRFNTWETPVAAQVFVPIHEGGATRVRYDSSLLKFSVSVSWRVLTAHLLAGAWQDAPPKIQAATATALKTWHEVLNGHREHPGRFEQHIWPADLIESATAPGKLPPRMNEYLVRAVDMDIVHNGQRGFAFAKMGRLMLFGMIGDDSVMGWHGTRIHVREGVLGADRYEIPMGVLEYLTDRVRESSKRMGSISPRQREVIDRTFRKDLDRFAGSELFTAMQRDVEMFGEDPVFANERRVPPDEPSKG